MASKVSDYTILFVEDERALRENYVRYLKRYFTHVYEAGDGEEAYQIYKDKKPQLLIIDINIPKLNGLELLKKIRKFDHTTKAIMLTAHKDVEYLLEATELNLTKYLVKPITREDLKKSLALAVESMQNFTVTSNQMLTLKEDYIWNYEKKELLQNGVTISLTKTENKILTILFSKTGRVFSYDEIVDYIWNDFSEYKIDSLKTLVKNLRRKLPEDTIMNVFGVGYRVN